MAMNQTQLDAMWDKARGRVKEAWGALTDDDLDRAEGRWDQLVGVIREKTGDTLETVERKLDAIFDQVRESPTDH